MFSSVTHWQDIQAQNDTNKKIIFKFMRKGFTSLSAEELACTMVNPDFTIDFKNVTNEDWLVKYRHMVVQRLHQCKFNFKWKTRLDKAQTGMGELAEFFVYCQRGDTEKVILYLRQFKD